jgi:pimeloyl-ACP methyl ester carboxylesterase
MATLERPDGAWIHYEAQGEGELVVLLASYWSWVPGTYAELLADLAADHRVVTYHLRGNGDSTEEGPFDMQTDAGDLEALVDQVGGPAVLLATADSSNRAVTVANRRADLVAAVVSFGAAPFSVQQFEGNEGMVASATVINAFLEMLESNYRGAMRTFMESTNPQMSSDELRDLVARQAEFCGEQAALGRVRSWLEDEPTEDGRALADRLWILAAPDVAGAWLPPAAELARVTKETFPDAHVLDVVPGPVSNPSATAEAIRTIAATALEALEQRK